MHVHLDHHHCLEVIVLQGKSKEVRQTADSLISTKGVQHGHLIVAIAE
jgi:CopG family nickel-responsive transcriptional regulator